MICKCKGVGGNNERGCAYDGQNIVAFISRKQTLATADLLIASIHLKLAFEIQVHSYIEPLMWPPIALDKLAIPWLIKYDWILWEIWLGPQMGFSFRSIITNLDWFKVFPRVSRWNFNTFHLHFKPAWIRRKWFPLLFERAKSSQHVFLQFEYHLHYLLGGISGRFSRKIEIISYENWIDRFYFLMIYVTII